MRLEANAPVLRKGLEPRLDPGNVQELVGNRKEIEKRQKETKTQAKHAQHNPTKKNV